MLLYDQSSNMVRGVNARSQIERVQRKFLRFAAYVLKIPCPPHNYNLVLLKLKLPSLVDRRFWCIPFLYVFVYLYDCHIGLINELDISLNVPPTTQLSFKPLINK